MESLRYEGELQPLIEWAVNRGTGKEAIDAPPEPFRSWVAELMGLSANTKYWVGVITPQNRLDGDWVEGYPHCHVESVNWHPDTMTVVTYLVAPESGGEIALGGRSKDDPYTFIEVEPGLTTIMDATLWHGVKPVHAGTRIALISSAPPAGRKITQSEGRISMATEKMAKFKNGLTTVIT